MTMMIFIYREVVGLSVVRSLSSMPQFLPFPELLTSNNATQHTTVVHGEPLVKILNQPCRNFRHKPLKKGKWIATVER
ncbi:hypothetical protein FBBNIHIM_12295 [Pseudocitrobacter vendiensis]|uniref:Secreted protein n=1 Tax=Pseudocitrobacter vendiensis TaxID=2488306 RepID=A0ABN8TAR8_9ENTR|nr:hypothetical protein FBBNIHIM_12295 [Pseudocitrobacter vendiensis]